jgi:hypothetical protein
MSILVIMLVLVLVGVGLWLINSYIPMDAKIKMILNIAVVIILVIWLLKVSGLWGTLAGAHI